MHITDNALLYNNSQSQLVLSVEFKTSRADSLVILLELSDSISNQKNWNLVTAEWYWLPHLS